MEFHGAGVQCDERYKEWWAKRRHSEEPPGPYEFLLNFGLSPEILKTALWKILAAACDSDEQSGFMDYLVRQMFLKEDVPEPSFMEWRENYFDCQSHPDHRIDFNKSLLYFAISKKKRYEPSDEDLMSLLNLYSARRIVSRWQTGLTDSVAEECIIHS